MVRPITWLQHELHDAQTPALAAQESGRSRRALAVAAINQRTRTIMCAASLPQPAKR